MSVSVVIPTYGHPEALLRAVRSLQEQRLDRFEIVVVDNAADPEVERSLSQLNGCLRVPARYVPEPELGLHHARHAGANAAAGDLLAFTDDDATFHPRWLQAYADAFERHPEMAAAGGPVRPVWEEEPPEWLLDFIGGDRVFGMLSLMEPYDEFRLEPGGFFFGVNMAIRRDALARAGGFHPEAFGDVWLGDGESGLNRRLWEMGARVGYVPGAAVYHHIPPARTTEEYLCRRMANEGACTEYAAFHQTPADPARCLLRLGRIGLDMARLALITAARMALQRRFAGLRARMGLAYQLSRARYVCRLLHDPEFRRFVAREDWLERNVRERCASA